MKAFHVFVACASAVGLAGFAGVAWEAYRTRKRPAAALTTDNVRDACGEGCTVKSTSMAHQSPKAREDAEIERRAELITKRLGRIRARRYPDSE